uniref:Uncharacterized protein n=1 Tax=Oncorhynchus kisutch TaxID=8019 RepID=A0A8C7E0M6_ONCKI
MRVAEARVYSTTHIDYKRMRGLACPELVIFASRSAHINSGPDLAKCFFCLKELEGWEPEDDPE